MAIIYQTTNLVNNKIYIGVHSGEKEEYLGSGIHLTRAIKKYGRENFKRETLYEFETLEEAYAKEEEIVTKEFIERSDVYNVALGGKGGNVKSPSPESRAKMSAAAKKRMADPRNNPMFGKNHDETTRKKIAETRKKNKVGVGESNPMYGKERKDLSTRNKLPKRWMNNGTKNKLALLEEVDNYLKEGYVFGKLSSKREKEALTKKGKDHPHFGRKHKKKECACCGRLIGINNFSKHKCS